MTSSTKAERSRQRAELDTILELATALFPLGTGGCGAGELPSEDLRAPPDWPPDLFAFAGMVMERYGIYADPRFTAGWHEGGYRFRDGYGEAVRQAAMEWRAKVVAPRPVIEAWKRLLINRRRPAGWRWQDDIMFLLIVADEASIGLGFDFAIGDEADFFARLVFEQLDKYRATGRSDWPHIPHSLCLFVAPHHVCVQPKTNTPNVGCTSRSFSHHLSLLPPIGTVKSGWIWSTRDRAYPKHFNVLVVPFPFTIEASDFEPLDNPHDAKNAFFRVRQGWMRRHHGDAATGLRVVSDLLMVLVREAEREARTIHAVVLPELALPGDIVLDVVQRLAKDLPDLELFVSGVLDRGRGEAFDRNCAFTACLANGELAQYWRQPKHHRWRLEEGQIRRYDLGFVLDPERNWWEGIDIHDRSCVFTVVRPHASFVTLVCEDLARFDPIMPLINAVGPNLLIALLMDGPQMERRWPGRYATVLADDPGTSVLSVTSLGMIERSNEAGQVEGRQVALWKEAGQSARELHLPRGHHALVLSLTMAKADRQTMDMRIHNETDCRFRLSGVRPVALPSEAGIEWTDT